MSRAAQYEKAISVNTGNIYIFLKQSLKHTLNLQPSCSSVIKMQKGLWVTVEDNQPGRGWLKHVRKLKYKYPEMN